MPLDFSPTDPTIHPAGPRLREFCRSSGTSMRALSLKIGRGEKFVADIVSGRSRHPDPRALDLLSEQTGIPRDELAHAEGDDPHAAIIAGLRVGLFMDAAIDAILAEETKSAAYRKDIVDDIKHFCGTWVGRDPSAVPADAYHLNTYAKDWTPEGFGVSRKRWSNVWSSVNQGLIAVGAIPANRKPIRSVGESWRTLYEALVRKSEWAARKLSPFIRYCDSCGIIPDEVSDDTVLACVEFRKAFTLQRDLTKAVTNIRDSWNKTVELVPSWPRIPITAGLTRTKFTFPDEMFPESFNLDIKRYQACQGIRGQEITPGMTILERARATHVTRMDPVTRKVVVDGPLGDEFVKKQVETLRLVASSMVRLGELSFDDITEIADIADPGIVDRFLRDDLEVRLGLSSQYAGTMVKHLESMARRWVPDVSVDELIAFKEIKKFANDKAENLGRMSEIDRRRLAPFLNDVRNMAVLVSIPEWEFENLETERRRNGGFATHDMALRAESAIAVLIEETLPVRWGDLRHTMIDANIIRSTRRNGPGTLHYKIRKTGRHGVTDAQGTLAPWKMRLIDLYTKHYRPRLIEGDPSNPYLFPGAVPGEPKSHGQLGHQVTAMVRDWTGHYVNPHLWRKLMGGYLYHVTKDLKLVAALLGHTPDSQATRVYVEIQTAFAVAELDDHVARLAQQAMHPARRRTR